MKVGIITFHRATNYGAVLQAYALQQFLVKEKLDARIIDYKSRHLEKQYRSFYISSFSIKNIILAVAYYRIRKLKNQRFKQFRKQYLLLSEKKDIKRDELQFESKEYDFIITGSDQVWNPKATNWDDAYLLKFADNKKKVSYAASLGTNTVDDKTKQFLKENLEGFKHISIRESINKKQIENLINRRIYVNIDPVFLIEEERWNQLIKDKKKIKKRYVFIYCLHEPNCYKYGEEIAKKYNLDIIYIPNSLKIKLKGKKVMTAGIRDFLSYIKNADYVVTDSFHVTAFSIIFRNNFFIALKKQKSELNFRITDLLTKLSLTSQIIHDESDFNNKPNYVNIAEKIDIEKAKTKEYFELLRK